MSVHLIEVSPALSAKQAEKLNISSEKPVDSTLDEGEYYMHGVTEDGIKVYWYYSINDVPRKFSIILAHEFFDAMPIKKLQVLVKYKNHNQNLFIAKYFFECFL